MLMKKYGTSIKFTLIDDEQCKSILEWIKTTDLDMSDTLGTNIFSECSHEWTYYRGLTEAYRFCTKCDKKS